LLKNRRYFQHMDEKVRSNLWGSDGLIDFEAGRWIATLDALIGRIVDGCAVVAMRAWWRWLCLLGRVCGRFG
jgi:hypothetical protein